MKINDAPSNNIEQKMPYTLIPTLEYLDFKNIEITKVDESKPWKPAVTVEVEKAGGEKVEIDANTPFYILRNNKGEELTVSAATAGHIDSLHIKGTDAGSLFDEPSFAALMEDAAKKISTDISSLPGVSSFDIEMNKSMGREGIASLRELQQSGILTKEDVDKVFILKEEVFELNHSGTKVDKEEFILKHKGEKVGFQLIRGEVLVPIVDTPKKETTKLFMVFGPSESDDRKTLYTAAPGRNMPRHPNPSQHLNNGVFNEATFKESSDAWFNTVMLVGGDNK